MKKEETKELILGLTKDLVSEFLYYGRKECEQMPLGKIQKAIKNGTVTVDEIVETFKQGLLTSIK